MATKQIIRIPEKALVPITFTNTEGPDINGLVVSIYAVDPSTGTSYELTDPGNPQYGAAAGTEFTINCDFANVPAPKRYRVEGAADVAAANPVTVIPNAKTAHEVIADVYAMAIF